MVPKNADFSPEMGKKLSSPYDGNDDYEVTFLHYRIQVYLSLHVYLIAVEIVFLYCFPDCSSYSAHLNGVRRAAVKKCSSNNTSYTNISDFLPYFCLYNSHSEILCDTDYQPFLLDQKLG